MYVPTQGNISFKWACTTECLVMCFSDPFFSFGHNNCLKNRSNGKCNNILNIWKTLAQTKLVHLINLLSLFPDFVFSFANGFLHWILSNWNRVVSNYRYLFLICQFIFDVSGLNILWFSYFWLATVALITLLDLNKYIPYKTCYV